MNELLPVLLPGLVVVAFVAGYLGLSNPAGLD